MPYRLVHGLQKLMTMDFDAKPSADLMSAEADVPEEVLEEVEKIACEARQLFGSGLRPNPRQEYIMEQAGFRVEPGKVDMVGWKTGKIITPKGTIFYP